MALFFKVLSAVLIITLLGMMNIGTTAAEPPYFVDCASTPVTNATELECLALVSLYNSTGGSAWTNNSGWLSAQNVDDWYGVGVDVVGGHVSSIELEGNHLVGIIPSSVSEFKFVLTLDLEENSLSGSIPADINGMTSLVTLDLRSNSLEGGIPPSIADLTNL